jgi:DNA-binding phage protein
MPWWRRLGSSLSHPDRRPDGLPLMKETTMKVTQVEIAERVGLDVSSVNKILNESPGPVFKKETIARVLKTATEMGYDFLRPTKSNYIAALREVVPLDGDEKQVAKRLGLSVRRLN